MAATRKRSDKWHYKGEFGVGDAKSDYIRTDFGGSFGEAGPIRLFSRFFSFGEKVNTAPFSETQPEDWEEVADALRSG